MNAEDRPRFGKGVRLRRDADGTVMLLVPEGALTLNESAAVTLELVDGTRSVGEIVAALTERFEVDARTAHEDACDLLRRLAERRLIETA